MVGAYSLYVHIPFCTRKCPYCHFYVLPNDVRLHALYRQALHQEWQRQAPLVAGGQLVSLYLGGGTPSLLPLPDLEALLQWVAPPPGIEITLEANPETFTPAYARALRSLGINRLSFGVQSLDPPLLLQLGRTHGVPHVYQALKAATEAGFENISIDLMYELPGQTLASWQQTVEAAFRLPITHLSLYNLTFEPQTSFYKHRHTLQPQVPTPETACQMLETLCTVAAQKGWERYEISAFCQPGYASQHNLGYWTFRPFLGLGPSAFSYWEGARTRNVANIYRYANALAAGNTPTDFCEKLEGLEHIAERLAIGLRILEGVAHEPWPAPIKKALENLEGDGLIEQTTEKVRLTSRGRLFYDTVGASLIQ